MCRTVPTPTLVFFFFSSSRRHTSYIGDWSSDVCSSDLDVPARPARARRAPAPARAPPGEQRAGGARPRGTAAARGGAAGAGGGGGDGQRGGPSAIARNAFGIRAGRGVCRSGGDRCRSRELVAFRVSSGIWLSYLVPDECRDGAAGERSYPLAGPRFDQGDREGTSRTGPGRTDLSRLVRRGQRSRREFLSVIQPDDAGQVGRRAARPPREDRPPSDRVRGASARDPAAEGAHGSRG